VQVAAGLFSLQAGSLTLGYLVAILATIRVGERLLQRFGPTIGFTLFGIGLGFYATPSTDAALSNVPDAQVGTAAGIYKMASGSAGLRGCCSTC
jgi:MFS transporter, DHA2 family, multidrug resistance protein